MKNLRLLNKLYFLIIFIFSIGLNSFAEENPVDIWDLDKKKNNEKIKGGNIVNENQNGIETINESGIFNMQSQASNNIITFDSPLETDSVKIIGLYDPEDYGLDINMWSNSDGDQLKSILSKLNKIDLSNDASELVKIAFLTNAFNPVKNISSEEFLKYKSEWLIKNSDLALIEEYLVKNQTINEHPKLTRYLVDEHLSASNLDKACEIFEKNNYPIDNEYLSKFNIYCLIEKGNKDEAQIIFDLKKELGFKDNYFEKKIGYLFGYSNQIDKSVSEKSILDFHLAHKTNPDFNFEPNDTTKKIIWKYLSSSNLLRSFQNIETTELDKISTIEMAVHNKNYPEKDLLELYKRFQFNINQLLNPKDSYNSLSNIETRALIYQKILLESEMIEKLKLLKILKNSFENDDIGGAFDVELKKFLDQINPLEVPDNLTSFYYTNIKIKSDVQKKIKFNNDILHQSKLINYFNGDYSKSKIEKDLNNFLKKIKKDKKYFLSKNDIIFLDSMKSDGIFIDKKYDDLYQVSASEIPTDIQVMINNNEKGATLLRLAEVIGQDKLERIDEDTIYFIINALNQLNIDLIRNKILLKVLPLKV